MREQELLKQEALERKYNRICTIKELVDKEVSTEDILEELNIGKNRLKDDKKTINRIPKVRVYMDMGLSDCVISQRTRYTLNKISIYKLYIDRQPNLFK